MKFWWQRLRQPYYYAGVAIGVTFVLMHILLVMIPDTTYLNGVRVDHISLSEWIGFAGSQQYSYTFFLILPLLSSLGVGLVFVEDISSGFNLRVLKNTRVHYVTGLTTFTFINGFVTATLPLSIDAFFAWLLFPNLVPDLILNRGLITSRVTYFSDVAFQRPFRLILIYILIAGCAAGLFALVGSLLGAIFQNTYLELVGPFVLTLLLSILANVFPQLFISPSAVIAPMSPNYLPVFTTVIFGFMGLMVFTIGGIYYVAKYKAQV